LNSLQHAVGSLLAGSLSNGDPLRASSFTQQQMTEISGTAPGRARPSGPGSQVVMSNRTPSRRPHMRASTYFVRAGTSTDRSAKFASIIERRDPPRAHTKLESVLSRCRP
jgi:hypothetical protein